MNISEQWLAGFFDGEGSIGITVSGKYRRCILRMTLVNTDYEVMEGIQKEYGGLLTWRKQFRPDWKQACCIQWTNRQASSLISKIGPYIILKKKQIELAMEFLELKDSPGRLQSSSVCNVPSRERKFVTRLKPEILEKENDIRSKFLILNKKGRAA